MITKEQFDNGYTYSEYRKLSEELANNGETTGPYTEEHAEFSKLNWQRMKRLDKTLDLDDEITEKLSKIPCPVNWLLITESWCGDAAQNVPILNKMAEASPNVNLRLILRDENLDIMDQFLTNGSRAIPKLIVLDGDMNEIGTWGPRPSTIQEMVMENKRIGKVPFSEFSKVVQNWYNTDKGKTLQREMLEVIEGMKCVLDERP